MAKCKYCGQNVTAGGGCSKSPHKYHEVDAGPKKCIYCGQIVTAVVAVQRVRQKVMCLVGKN